MLSLNLSYLPSAITAIDQIKNDQLSQSYFNRHIRTRACVMELFLRVAFRTGIETLSAVVKLPFAAVKFVFDHMGLGHVLPSSVSFGEVANHLKRASQCATALTLDFSALLIDPSQAQARLVNRKLVTVEPQPEPVTGKSLLKYLWNPKVATFAGVVITAAVLHRLGVFAALSSLFTPGPGGNPERPNSVPNVKPEVPYSSRWVALVVLVGSIGVGCISSLVRRVHREQYNAWLGDYADPLDEHTHDWDEGQWRAWNAVKKRPRNRDIVNYKGNIRDFWLTCINDVSTEKKAQGNPHGETPA